MFNSHLISFLQNKSQLPYTCVVQLLRSAGALLLQREVPEDVNVRAAAIAAEAGVPVILDCGGVEGPISPELLRSVSILSPNETELARLTGVHAPALIPECTC